MTGYENRLLPLEGDDIAYGAAVESGSLALVELVAGLGVDWVWVDLEHKNPGPLDARYLENVARAAACGGAEPVVRVPSGDPSVIRKVRDAGVRTVVVPRVETVEAVRDAVRAARFTHDGGPGKRGLSVGRSSRYGADLGGADRAYPASEDHNTLVGVLVEERAAVEAIDDILDVAGLDFVFPGPGDLGVSMGAPLADDPAVADALATVEARCRERGMPMMGHLGSNFGLEDVGTAATEGYRLASLGDEFEAVRQALGDRLGRVDA